MWATSLFFPVLISILGLSQCLKIDIDDLLNEKSPIKIPSGFTGDSDPAENSNSLNPAKKSYSSNLVEHPDFISDEDNNYYFKNPAGDSDKNYNANKLEKKLVEKRSYQDLSSDSFSQESKSDINRSEDFDLKDDFDPGNGVSGQYYGQMMREVIKPHVLAKKSISDQFLGKKPSDLFLDGERSENFLKRFPNDQSFDINAKNSDYDKFLKENSPNSNKNSFPDVLIDEDQSTADQFFGEQNLLSSNKNPDQDQLFEEEQEDQNSLKSALRFVQRKKRKIEEEKKFLVSSYSGLPVNRYRYPVNKRYPYVNDRNEDLYENRFVDYPEYDYNRPSPFQEKQTGPSENLNAGNYPKPIYSQKPGPIYGIPEFLEHDTGNYEPIYAVSDHVSENNRPFYGISEDMYGIPESSANRPISEASEPVYGISEPILQNLKHGNSNAKKFSRFLPNFGSNLKDQYYDVYKKEMVKNFAKKFIPASVRFNEASGGRGGGRNGYSVRRPQYNGPRYGDYGEGYNYKKRMMNDFEEKKRMHKRNRRDVGPLPKIGTKSSLYKDQKFNVSQTLENESDDIENIFKTTPKIRKQLKKGKTNQNKSRKSNTNLILRAKRAYRDDPRYYSPLFENQNEFNNYLTQEYFKNLAKGNKKKNFGPREMDLKNDFGQMKKKFEKKRTPGIMDIDYDVEELRRNPELLQKLHTDLEDLEEEFVVESEKLMKSLPNYRLSDPEDHARVRVALANLLVRIEAVEAIKKLLNYLDMNKKEFGMEELPIERRNSKGRSGVGQIEYEEEYKKRKWEDGENENERNWRNKRIGEDGKERKKKNWNNDQVHAFFGANKKEECPVLENLILSCEKMSNVVDDNLFMFAPACIRHEICYMCGSGLDISFEECERSISTELESKCDEFSSEPRAKVRCLNAANQISEILEDPTRFDSKGACTYDPCIRELLDSR